MSQQGEQFFLDVPAIRARARAEWEQKARKSLSIPEKIDESVPWWLIVVAAVFFLLSIPHTMTVFERATPMLGYVAPAGIEFGLLYAAFRRRQTGRMPWFLRILEVLLFFTAIIANGVGSFDAIVSRGDVVRDLSFAEMIAAFPTLPATSQVALLLSPLMALIIPVGTVAVGEGLAHLVMDRRRRGNPMEERWQEVSAQVEFEALRDAALMSGMTPGRAVRLAEQIIYGSRLQTSVATASSVVSVSAPDSARTHEGGQRSSAAHDGRHGSGQGYSKNMSARDVARAYIEANPDALNMSVRQLAAEVGIGKTVAAEVMREYNQETFSSNGNGHEY
mgnify:CR=1 FL=1